MIQINLVRDTSNLVILKPYNIEYLNFTIYENEFNATTINHFINSSTNISLQIIDDGDDEIHIDTNIAQALQQHA